MRWNLYIARCNDNTLYTGVSSDTEKRISRHNKGLGAQWIKQHGRAEIVYTEQYDDYPKAHRRELQIKKWSRIKKENLIKYKHPTKLTFN
ncbi:MAG: GIY-YIG nuclease family protein [Patescibacteria group bacterium]